MTNLSKTLMLTPTTWSLSRIGMRMRVTGTFQKSKIQNFQKDGKRKSSMVLTISRILQDVMFLIQEDWLLIILVVTTMTSLATSSKVFLMIVTVRVTLLIVMMP